MMHKFVMVAPTRRGGLLSHRDGDSLCRELLYYPQAKIYDHTLLTKQSYAFDA